jgi:hypothetical protein
MSESDSTHVGGVQGEDPAHRGGTIGSGLEPDESTEGALMADEARRAAPDANAAEDARGRTAAEAVGSTTHEGLVEPDGVDADESADR